jgi:hypothetical protein
MPVVEAIELDRAATDLGLPRGALIVNGMSPDRFPDGAAALAGSRPTTALTRTIVDVARSSIALRADQDAMVARLDAIPARRLVLPLIPAPRVGPDELELLADHLGDL